jgi:hypothetical protein
LRAVFLTQAGLHLNHGINGSIETQLSGLTFSQSSGGAGCTAQSGTCQLQLFTWPFLIAPVGARTQEMVVGVNVVNPMRASIADQNALLSQLKAAEVHVIRCGIPN